MCLGSTFQKCLLLGYNAPLQYLTPLTSLEAATCSTTAHIACTFYLSCSFFHPSLSSSVRSQHRQHVVPSTVCSALCGVTAGLQATHQTIASHSRIPPQLAPIQSTIESYPIERIGFREDETDISKCLEEELPAAVLHTSYSARQPHTATSLRRCAGRWYSTRSQFSLQPRNAWRDDARVRTSLSKRHIPAYRTGRWHHRSWCPRTTPIWLVI